MIPYSIENIVEGRAPKVSALMPKRVIGCGETRIEGAEPGGVTEAASALVDGIRQVRRIE